MSKEAFKNDPRDVQGLSTFLLTVLDLIKDGKTETCKDIENNIATGVAKYLTNKYSAYFKKFSSDNNAGIDEFYSLSDPKFNRDENDGLYWVIEQAFNGLH